MRITPSEVEVRTCLELGLAYLPDDASQERINEPADPSLAVGQTKREAWSVQRGPKPIDVRVDRLERGAHIPARKASTGSRRAARRAG
jgi:hypothetical protein